MERISGDYARMDKVGMESWTPNKTPNLNRRHMVRESAKEKEKPSGCVLNESRKIKKQIKIE